MPTISLTRKPDKEEESLGASLDLDYFVEDNSPLFFQPGKTGFYSPRQGRGSEERINCFRNVGRCVKLYQPLATVVVVSTSSILNQRKCGSPVGLPVIHVSIALSLTSSVLQLRVT